MDSLTYRERITIMRHSLEERSKALELFIYCKKNYNDFVLLWGNLHISAPPNRRYLFRLLQKFRDQGSVLDRKRSGRKSVRTSELVISVGAYFESHPFSSINTFLKTESWLNYTTVWRILKHDLKFKSYKSRRVHKLFAEDLEDRVAFANDTLNRLEMDPTYLVNILWADECCIKLNGVANTNNIVYWSPKNPHIVHERNMEKESVMVYAVISCAGIVALGYFDEMDVNLQKKIKSSVSGLSYLEMMEKNLFQGISRVFPPSERQKLYYMHDGAGIFVVVSFFCLHNSLLL